MGTVPYLGDFQSAAGMIAAYITANLQSIVIVVKSLAGERAARNFGNKILLNTFRAEGVDVYRFADKLYTRVSEFQQLMNAVWPALREIRRTKNWEDLSILQEYFIEELNWLGMGH